MSYSDNNNVLHSRSIAKPTIFLFTSVCHFQSPTHTLACYSKYQLIIEICRYVYCYAQTRIQTSSSINRNNVNVIIAMLDATIVCQRTLNFMCSPLWEWALGWKRKKQRETF